MLRTGLTDVDILMESEGGDVEIMLTQTQGQSSEVTDSGHTVSLATTGGETTTCAKHVHMHSTEAARYANFGCVVYATSKALPAHHSVLISDRDTSWYSVGGWIPERC